MGQGQAFLAEGQTYASCRTQGDAWAEGSGREELIQGDEEERDG